MSIGVAACEASSAPTTSRADEDEIGACGANADPTTGVICKLSYEWARNANPVYASAETFEKDTLDFVRCKWSLDCTAPGAPYSLSGQACVSVVGTGCRGDGGPGVMTLVFQLPPGTRLDQLDDFCKAHASPNSSDKDDACALLNRDVDQGEDLCCLPRVPPPPTRDAGVTVLDAQAIGAP
ncbi:MAG TPA: hypothetical protein VFP84_27485 [Kofleriaceae bacterium]|nr:hypothetical protein [Kofleriaceae bacterium]